MKGKILLVLVAVAVIALLSAGVALAGISTTKHNLSTTAGNPGTVKALAGQTTEICVFCHTPHFALTTAKPLWNLTVTTQTFGTYGDTLAGTAFTAPTGVSKSCLSCHDGATAVNSLVNMPGATRAGTVTMAASTVDVGGSLLDASLANLGTSMADDHPVSIAYTATTKASLRALSGSGTVVKAKASEAAGTAGATVECSSCHDPHAASGDTASSGTTASSQFLRMSNAGSALCLACHVK